MLKALIRSLFSVSNAAAATATAPTATKGTSSQTVTLSSQKTAPETSTEAKPEDAEGPQKMKGALGKLKSKTKKLPTASPSPGEYSYVGHRHPASVTMTTESTELVLQVLLSIDPQQHHKMHFRQSGVRTRRGGTNGSGGGGLFVAVVVVGGGGGDDRGRPLGNEAGKPL